MFGCWHISLRLVVGDVDLTVVSAGIAPAVVAQNMSSPGPNTGAADRSTSRLVLKQSGVWLN